MTYEIESADKFLNRVIYYFEDYSWYEGEREELLKLIAERDAAVAAKARTDALQECAAIAYREYAEVDGAYRAIKVLPGFLRD